MNPMMEDDGYYLGGAFYHDPRGPGPHYNGPTFTFEYENAPQMLDAGFAAGYEVIPISERELIEMPEEEWHLLQRLISEPVAYPNTQIACSNVAAGNVVLTILHHVPCITTLEKI